MAKRTVIRYECGCYRMYDGDDMLYAIELCEEHRSDGFLSMRMHQAADNLVALTRELEAKLSIEDQND